MSDIETLIKGCENWVNTHKGENYLLTYSSVVELLAILKGQETKWIHREDLDFKDKLGCNHFHGMCGNCGFIHDFIDGHTGQYKYCPQCGWVVKWE